MVVAFHVPHNEGLVYGIFTEPDQTTNLALVDLYEVDGQVRTFANFEDAEKWVREPHGVGLPQVGELKPNQTYDIQYG